MKKAAVFFTAGLCSLVILSSLCISQSYRERREQPEKLLDIAGVKPGMIVGEAGAGDGFLTFFLSKRVGESGRVYANDINRNSLRRLNERSEREGVENIITVLGKVDDPIYPVNDLDLVTMIRAFHDFTEQVAWLKNLKKYMKKEAGVFIFEVQDRHVGLDREKVANLAEEAGFELTRCEELHGGFWLYELRIKNGS